MTATSDYFADAPDFRAWAGDGPAAELVRQLDGYSPGVLAEFRSRCNTEARGGDEYDPEAIAENLLAELS